MALGTQVDGPKTRAKPHAGLGFTSCAPSGATKAGERTPKAPQEVLAATAKLHVRQESPLWQKPERAFLSQRRKLDLLRNAARSEGRDGMRAWLGSLVYWIACSVAAAALCVAIYAATEGTASAWYTVSIFASGGVLIWMAGRATRYALAPAKRPVGRPRKGHDG